MRFHVAALTKAQPTIGCTHVAKVRLCDCLMPCQARLCHSQLQVQGRREHDASPQRLVAVFEAHCKLLVTDHTCCARQLLHQLIEAASHADDAALENISLGGNLLTGGRCNANALSKIQGCILVVDWLNAVQLDWLAA